MTFIESAILLASTKCLNKFQVTFFSIVYLKGIVLFYMSHKHSKTIFILSPAILSFCPLQVKVLLHVEITQGLLSLFFQQVS